MDFGKDFGAQVLNFINKAKRKLWIKLESLSTYKIELVVTRKIGGNE